MWPMVGAVRAAILAWVRRIKYLAMEAGVRRWVIKRDVGTQTKVTDESEAGLPAVAPGGVGRDGAR